MNDEAKKKVAEAMVKKVSGVPVKQPEDAKKVKYPLPAGQATIGVRG